MLDVSVLEKEKAELIAAEKKAKIEAEKLKRENLSSLLVAA
jgi:hypothetical protein